MTRRTLSVLVTCDRHEHEIRLLTDGKIGYAYGIGHLSTDAGTVLAEAVRPGLDAYEVACNQPLGDDRDSEPCDGVARYTPADDDWQTDDTEVEQALDEWGREVER
jgi:hypothetical protein